MNIELKNLNNSGEDNYKNDFIMIDPTNLLQSLEYFRIGFSKNNNSIIAQNFFFIMQKAGKSVPSDLPAEIPR